MTARLQDKIAFITGGGSGIGAATAERFAEEGARVVICGRRQAPLDEVVGRIRAAGGQAEAVVADVSDEAAFTAALEDCARRHGRLDILVNNAMAYTWGAIEAMSSADWQANFSTSVDGTFWGTRSAMQLMKEKGGAIVNLSSAAAVLGAPGWYVDYAASKGAIDSFTVGLAREVAEENIRVNAVRPGIIATDIHASAGEPDRAAQLRSIIPMKREGTADEVAAGILWLLSDEASYTTGTILTISGGR